MSDGNDWGNPGGQPGQPQQPGQAPQQPQQGFGQQPQQAPQQQMTHQPGTPAKVKHQLEQNDIIALIVSFFFPGIGHVMLGQTVKGLVIFGAVILTCGIGYALNLLIVADAYFVAMCKKDRAVGDWDFFPDYNRYI